MKDLKHYFDKAARQEEIVPLAEIAETLSRQKQNVQNFTTNPWHALFHLHLRKTGLTALVIFAVLLGSIIVFLDTPDRSHVNQKVFVPQTQRRVMHLVNHIAASPGNGEITVSPFGSDTDRDATAIPIHLRSKFELSEDKLELLGITFLDKYIQYEGNVKDKGYVAFRILRTGLKSPPSNFYPLEVSSIQRPGIKEYEFYPWFMTDEAGYQGFRYRFRDEPALKTTSSYFLGAIDDLIPIEITRPGFEKMIFWFSQTPELMRILESAAMISRTTEVSDVSNDQATDKTSETIQVEIFPTISKGDVQVIANVLKKQRLEITLLNSSGEVLQMPVNKQILEAGDHHFSMDLSTLRKGLYFLRIKSDPGAITIHRLFKE